MTRWDQMRHDAAVTSIQLRTSAAGELPQVAKSMQLALGLANLFVHFMCTRARSREYSPRVTYMSHMCAHNLDLLDHLLLT